MAVNPFTWSTTASSNGSLLSGVNIAEDCLAANLNNMGRSIMAGIKEYLDVIGGAKITAGTANAQTLTTGLGLTDYQQGRLLAFEAGAALTNTGAATLAIDSLVAKSLKRVNGAALSAGDITAGGIYLIAYESGADAILLLNPTASGLSNVVDDTTPQLGADLDANGFYIGFDDFTGIKDDAGNEILTFQKIASAVNYLKIVNSDAGNAPALYGVGDDTDINVRIVAKGAGQVRIVGNLMPHTADGANLGGTTGWSDLFLASGGVIGWNSNDVTITHAANTLTFAGASSGYAFDVAPNVGGSNVALLGTEDQTLAGGARVTIKDLGTITTGTVTPDPGDRPMQKLAANGAFTLAPGTNKGNYQLAITMGASAGTITTSGWGKVIGSFTTTSGHKFLCLCTIDDAGSVLQIVSRQ